MEVSVRKNEASHTYIDGCPICNSEMLSYSKKTIRDNYELGECRSCKFKYSHPRPKMEFLVDYYNSISSVRFYKQSDRRALKDTRSLYKTIQKNNPSAKKILEVGCSTGYYLKGLELRGFDVCGSELSEDAATLAKEWYGVDVFTAEFPPDSHYGKYDVVVIHHVIEHVIDPKDFLDRASKYLKHNGILILETPNVNSFGIRVFGTNYPVFCPPGHLNFFSISTLEKALPNEHQKLISKTTSENGYVIYNCMNAFVAAIDLKSFLERFMDKKVEVDGNIRTKASNNKKYSYLKIMYKFSKITQTFLYPIFYIVDRMGWGENVSLVSLNKSK